MSAKKKKQNFIFHYKYKQLLEMLSYEDVGKIVFALCEYQQNGIDPNFTGEMRMAFLYIKKQIDEENNMYAAKCEQNQKAVEERWKKHLEKQNSNVTKEEVRKQPIQENTNVYERIQTVQSDTSYTDIDNDIDNDIDSDIDKDKNNIINKEVEEKRNKYLKYLEELEKKKQERS